MSTASNWLLNWAIAYMTPYLVDSGPGNANLQAKVFFLWGSCCFICIFFGNNPLQTILNTLRTWANYKRKNQSGP